MGIVLLLEQSAWNAEESCAQLQNSLGALDVPDVPAVGILLSMPTNLAADGSNIPNLSVHPYALSLSPCACAVYVQLAFSLNNASCALGPVFCSASDAAV